MKLRPVTGELVAFARIIAAQRARELAALERKSRR